MRVDPGWTGVPLVASPYDLRVSLGERIGESETRAAVKSGDVGFVHSVTAASAVDGPGVRVVVWLTGCQFRCVFCHNPDTWKVSNGIPVPLERAVDAVREQLHGLRTVKGGLTVSGGEPLVQDRFVVRLFAAVRGATIHTALDTNGYLGARLSDRELETCDLVMLGLKALDADLHRRITGMDNVPVIAFARRLAALRRPLWLRWVLVPGLTDDLEDIARIAEFAADLGNVEQVELIAFHQLGRFKWEAIGLPYECRNAPTASQDQIDRAMRVFRAAGLDVH